MRRLERNCKAACCRLPTRRQASRKAAPDAEMRLRQQAFPLPERGKRRPDRLRDRVAPQPQTELIHSLPLPGLAEVRNGQVPGGRKSGCDS